MRAGKHVYDVGVMGNGALAGLVAITSGTSTVYPWAAIIIGLIAGALYVFASRFSILMKVRAFDQPPSGHLISILPPSWLSLNVI